MNISQVELTGLDNGLDVVTRERQLSEIILCFQLQQVGL